MKRVACLILLLAGCITPPAVSRAGTSGVWLRNYPPGTEKVEIPVQGGGPLGQAGAVRMGVARALKASDGSLEPALRDGGFLTRDAREKERKKPGQPGARKKFQYSKR